MKLSEKTKYMILGMFFTGVVTTSVMPAMAKVSNEQIAVKFKNITIIADGSLVTPKDSDGNIIEPFVYDGTTYLPITSVGDAFGQEVSWDSTDNTVYIGKKEKLDIKSFISKEGTVDLNNSEYGKIFKETYTDASKRYEKLLSLRERVNFNSRNSVENILDNIFEIEKLFIHLIYLDAPKELQSLQDEINNTSEKIWEGLKQLKEAYQNYDDSKKEEFYEKTEEADSYIKEGLKELETFIN